MYRDLIGKQFKPGGKGPKYYDCRGLAEEYYRRLGRYFPSEETWSLRPEEIHSIFTNEMMNWVEIKVPESHCVVTFTLDDDRKWVSHMGVVLESYYQFIHVGLGMRVIVCRLDDLLWESRISGFYRHRLWT